MSVEINNQADRVQTIDFDEELPKIIDFWLVVGARCPPPPIQITPGEIGSVVAINNTIWVHHRYYVDYELSFELLNILKIYECLNNSFDYVGARCFSRVLSSHEDETFLFTDASVISIALHSKFECVNLDSSDAFADINLY